MQLRETALVQLSDLPDELLCSIFEYLPRDALDALSRTSQWAYAIATPILWRTVSLVDISCIHEAQEGEEPMWEYDDEVPMTLDDHDDLHIIRKLMILAENKFIAESVQELTHRCHLHPPAIFGELPSISFKTRTLSVDPRTLLLLRYAVKNMVNVHTLRIIFGHWNITYGLLRGFFSEPGHSKLRRLWLENCCLEGLSMDPEIPSMFPQLESIRLRRLYIRSMDTVEGTMFIPTRGGVPWLMQDGRGASRTTTVVFAENREQKSQIQEQENELLDGVVKRYDDYTYRWIAKDAGVVTLDDLEAGTRLRADSQTHPVIPPSVWLYRTLKMAATTLTSLNLDWIMWPSTVENPEKQTVDTLHMLSTLKFTNLKAFQFRNTVVSQTKLPEGIYLLDDEDRSLPSFLKFMEAHPKLQSLSWPIDRFFSHRRVSPEVDARAKEVVCRFSKSLREIRVDYDYSSRGELFTDDFVSTSEAEVMIRRRRFIDEFARHMVKIEHIKLEGGIPRDEKREVVRALRLCPLSKIVMIGVACPIGNTWGLNADYLHQVDLGHQNYPGAFEQEFEEPIYASMKFPPLPPTTTDFEPAYGWPPSPPMLHTVASYHASTVTELKFCGYNGSPIIYDPSGITVPMLAPLRYFHKLENLIISMWLLTYHGGDYNDEAIIAYWVDQRRSSSTALAILEGEENPNSFSYRLHKYYDPRALAEQVVKQIGPFLSPQAKSKPGGVRIRTSFCLGTVHSDIFDLDIRIGANDEIVKFSGPREEGEPGRRKEKMGDRRWF